MNTARAAATLAGFVNRVGMPGGADVLQEILGSYPWYGDNWHIGNVWVDSTSETGYTYDLFGDGDSHEEITEDETNDYLNRAESAWHDYARYVANTGEDPLSNYHLKEDEQVKRSYEVTVCNFDKSSVMFLSWRERARGPYRRPGQDSVPSELAEYLSLRSDSKHRLTLTDFSSVDDLKQRAHVDRFIRVFEPTKAKFMVTTSYVRPLSDSARAVLLRTAAKQHLRDLEKKSK